MGSTQPFFRRAVALPVAALIAAGSLVAVTSAAALADTSVPPLDLSTQALPTVQVDGVVWSQAIVGDTVYVAGQFTTAHPLSGGSVPRSNVLAYNLESGELISSFVANTNSVVRSISAAPDGSRIYIAGEFTSVDGKSHERVAALDPSTGTPLSSFSPTLNSGATGVVSTASTAYVIGKFTSANGQTVSRAVALSASTGATLNWKPAVGTGIVRAITISPDHSVVLIGGSFTSVNGGHAGGLAALSSGDGHLLPWAASSVVDVGDSQDKTGIYGLSSDGTYVYAAGWSAGAAWGQNALEGVVSMKWNTGALNWIEDCHGDSYGSSAQNGILYVVSHAHFCGNVPNGFGELPTNVGHRATAFSVKAAGVLATNTEQGPGYYENYGGKPAPVLMNYLPNLTPGRFTGQGQAAWSVASAKDYVVYGGEFPSVNGAPQQGLVRFYQTASSPVDAVTPPSVPTTGPTSTPTSTPTTGTGTTTDAKPNRVGHASVSALGPSKIAVRWSAPKSAATDKVTGYVVKAYKGSKLVRTVSVGKTKRLATVTGLARSTTYRIGVAAKNGHGTGRLSALHSAKTTSKGKNVSATKKPSKVKKPAAVVGKGMVRVRWKAPSTKGALGVSKYEVRIRLHGKTVKTVLVDDRLRSKLLSGLNRKTGYTVSVRAGSWAGWGAWSSSKGARTR